MTAGGEPVVELHRIEGMGHGTPLSAGGEDGSGTAGPYLLDVGISSSLEIALGWGIAEPMPDAASARSAKARKPQSRPPDRTARRSDAKPAPKPAIQPAADPAAGVRAIIEQALRTAGLMK
jgi:hypothetical protein